MNTAQNFSMQAIGLMSGTSLDGLDVCCCTFHKHGSKWDFTIDCACTYEYPDDLKRKLGTEAQRMNALEFIAFHSEYGRFLGRRVNDFISQYDVHPAIVASHGHTIFHEPHKRIMFQLGDGAAIAAETGIDTVFDFRRLDIMLGGQGAPLVPVGDRLLFGDFDFCLNLGGFSNISFERDDRRIAFDISPVNYVLNHYCRRIAHCEYDHNGEIARTGRMNDDLFDRLNALPFYRQEGPKSLGREWVETEVFPLIDSFGGSLPDILRTFCEHAAYQIARVTIPRKTILLTGGGAFNEFLVERISERTDCLATVGSPLIVMYKEALIFAFLGTLYMRDEASCLRSVTGATRDNVGGMLVKAPV
jgi:anhydro-N-acetylmuramic acid kinase